MDIDSGGRSAWLGKCESGGGRCPRRRSGEAPRFGGASSISAGDAGMDWDLALTFLSHSCFVQPVFSFLTGINSSSSSTLSLFKEEDRGGGISTVSISAVSNSGCSFCCCWCFCFCCCWSCFCCCCCSFVFVFVVFVASVDFSHVVGDFYVVAGIVVSVVVVAVSPDFSPVVVVVYALVVVVLLLQPSLRLDLLFRFRPLLTQAVVAAAVKGLTTFVPFFSTSVQKQPEALPDTSTVSVAAVA